MSFTVSSNRTGQQLFSVDTGLSDRLFLSPTDARRLLECLHSFGDPAIVVTMADGRKVKATELFGSNFASSMTIS